jgi:biotin operon repressor
MNPTAIQSVPNNRHERRFDQATYNTLTGLDARLLELIRYNSKYVQKKSHTRAEYSYQPQSYWAKKLGCCRATINRRIARLRKVGILEITRRRKLRGLWQTNLTKIRNWVWWRLGKLLQELRKRPDPCNKHVTHKKPYEEKENQKTSEGGPLAVFTQQILARWEARGLIKSQTIA